MNENLVSESEQESLCHINKISCEKTSVMEQLWLTFVICHLR